MKFKANVSLTAREVEDLHSLLSAHAEEFAGLAGLVTKINGLAKKVTALKAKAARAYTDLEAHEVQEGFMVSFAPPGVDEDDEEHRVEGEVVSFHPSQDGYKAPCFISVRNERGFTFHHEVHPLSEVRRYDVAG
ncbi:hypothetical protein [Streptomyces sp. NPDC097610]|uniref:hypothetical protein n=1 Tax=Streptomyces sp. NPDC097610 TaxID=3157227 RepID=UPI003318752B